MVKVLLLMVLCHIIDDFVMQPICLSKLKQREWWKNNIKFEKMYEDDYKTALFIHALSWSIMISLPVMFLTSLHQELIFGFVILNAIVHYIVDDIKANELKINLETDQKYHFAQILIYWLCVIVLTR